jgi:hypothetical protein
MSMKIFQWCDFSEWQQTILGLMGNYLDHDVIAAFRVDPPKYVVSDDLSWLNTIVRKVHGIATPDSSSLLTKKLLEHYTHIAAFHGCRPQSTESYSKHGLQACDPKKMAEIALRIFGDSDKVRHAIQSLKASSLEASYEEHNEGKVFFTLTQNELVNYCGHYLLYGSEYLGCIAHEIGAGQKLRRLGRATIIECNVPITRIGRDYIKELAGKILEEMFERVQDPDSSSRHNGFGFPVLGSLPAECIAGFHFPTQIPNPHNCMRLED